MNVEDFAFIRKGKIVKPLGAEEANLLSPVDHIVTQNHEHALLMLHGFASTPAVYRAILPKITGYDRIVCPALTGHASSTDEFAESTAHDWQQAAQMSCAKLVDTYEKVSIVGLSLGGSLALELSQTFKIQHLYLLAPALKLRYPIWLAQIGAKILKSLGLQTWPNRGGDIFSDAYQELSYKRLPLTAILEIYAYIQSQFPIQPNCPTDLFLGQYDTVVDTQHVAQYYKPQSNVKIHWLENSAHILPLDGDKEELVRCISI